MRFNPITLTLVTLLPTVAAADSLEDKKVKDVEVDEHIVVIGELMKKPTTVVTNPKQPRLPLPSYDGAGYLKTIPGFNIGRKGGAGGDPTLRDLGGSRVSIVDDGQHAYGTCGGRMDPPTAYVYPESYDSITVIKGPQTVKYGPVGSAGTVLFEKDKYGLSEPTTEGRASMTAGSFGRQDYIVELTGGDEKKYIDLEFNNSKSDHYQDGSGNTVQSKYDRNNAKIAFGWTPTEQTVIELSYGRSSGSAEYADRANKGRVIENENYALMAKHNFDHDVVTAVDFQMYYNQTNHIMDQFDAGVNKGSNVRRATTGGHLWFDLTFSSNLEAVIGVDFMNSGHEGRSIDPNVDNGLDDLLKKSFQDNLAYQNLGFFIEGTYELAEGRIVSGLRRDNWNTDLYVAQKGTRKDKLISGFARYEIDSGNSQYFIGMGYAERMPDYWELMKATENGDGKAFDLKPEKTAQIDVGWIYTSTIEFSTAFYYGKIKDYILIDASGPGTVSKNVDATVWGWEIGVNAPISQNWSTQATLSYSHGNNDSENRPLGQISPMEARVSLDYQKEQWTAGLYLRTVAEQDRVAIGQGNISGQDLGKTDGFTTLSFSAGWKASEQMLVTFGIENLFDTEYAEHISRSGAGNDVPGSQPMFRVNEPGRTAWIKLDYKF